MGTLTKSLISMVVSFLVTAVLGPVVIPWLHKLKFGQEIREEGPKWHQKKSGTPTMGGLMFIIGVTVAMVVVVAATMAKTKNVNLVIDIAIMYFVSLGFGAIGFIDDYIKVVKKRNLGLTAVQKFTMQCLVAIACVVCMWKLGYINTEIIIPFGSTITMPWWLYIPFVIVVITATVNAVNLTDGLDGLASSITSVVAFTFTISAFLLINKPTLIFGMSIVGGCLGFLIFNRYPAKVFMGDTGSLFLGGAIAVMAIRLRMPLFILIAGFVYLFEALSVIIQVISFKLTGKRIFKMSPIHHHFEMCGWPEKKIVTVFTLVTLILCVISIFAIFI